MKTAGEAAESAGLERAFHALSDDKRLRILELLREGECCVCDLATALDIRQSLLSFHLKTLKDAGIVRDRKDGRWVHYSLDSGALGRLRAYLGAVERAARGAGHRLCCRHAVDGAPSGAVGLAARSLMQRRE